MKIRVIVPVYNEELMLPLFLQHYERIADSIVVLDNDSTDRTREIAKAHPKVEMSVYRTEGFDDIEKVRQMNVVRAASKGFDWVVMADCDEFVTGREGTVREVLGTAKGDVLTPDGYELLKMDTDEPFDFQKPVLRQRRWGAYTGGKPLISRPSIGGVYRAGQHTFVGKGAVQAKERRLLYLHADAIELDYLMARKNSRPLNEKCKEMRLSYHRLWSREKYVERIEGLKKRAEFVVDAKVLAGLGY